MTPADGHFWNGPVVRYLLGSGISLYGDWLTTVALLVLLFRTTNSVTAPALYMLARVAPRVVGPAPGGVLTDRLGPVRLAVTCLLVQGLLTGAIVFTTGAGATWTVYPLVAAAQFVSSLGRPAYSAMPPRLTDSVNLGRLNGLYAGLFASSILVSPAIGALLLPHTTPKVLIAADAVSFALSAALIATLRIGRAPHGDDGTGSARGIRAGWSAITGDATLRSAAAAAFGNAAVITALQAVLVLAAAQHFNRDVDIGWLYAAVGGGGVLGGLLFLRPTPRIIRRREVVALAAGEVLPVIIFVFSTNFALAIALLFVSSVAATMYEVLATVAMQQRVPIGLLGRAGGATRVAQYTGMLVGAVASVALVKPLGWEATVVIVCAFAVVVLGVFTVTGPRDMPVATSEVNPVLAPAPASATPHS
ncbi:MAG: MFS transporter [Candidatus Dormibacteria bacterium]